MENKDVSIFFPLNIPGMLSPDFYKNMHWSGSWCPLYASFNKFFLRSCCVTFYFVARIIIRSHPFPFYSFRLPRSYGCVDGTMRLVLYSVALGIFSFARQSLTWLIWHFTLIHDVMRRQRLPAPCLVNFVLWGCFSAFLGCVTLMNMYRRYNVKVSPRWTYSV